MSAESREAKVIQWKMVPVDPGGPVDLSLPALTDLERREARALLEILNGQPAILYAGTPVTFLLGSGRVVEVVYDLAAEQHVLVNGGRESQG